MSATIDTTKQVDENWLQSVPTQQILLELVARALLEMGICPRDQIPGPEVSANASNLMKMAEVFNGCLRVSAIKASNYGTGNLKTFGNYGLLVRMWDKMARLKNLSENKTVKVLDDESINDTVRDLLIYSSYWLTRYASE